MIWQGWLQIALYLMMTGEVIYGGVGLGLYGMLLTVLLTVSSYRGLPSGPVDPAGHPTRPGHRRPRPGDDHRPRPSATTSRRSAQAQVGTTKR